MAFKCIAITFGDDFAQSIENNLANGRREGPKIKSSPEHAILDITNLGAF